MKRVICLFLIVGFFISFGSSAQEINLNWSTHDDWKTGNSTESVYVFGGEVGVGFYDDFNVPFEENVWLNGSTRWYSSGSSNGYVNVTSAGAVPGVGSLYVKAPSGTGSEAVYALFRVPQGYSLSEKYTLHYKGIDGTYSGTSTSSPRFAVFQYYNDINMFSLCSAIGYSSSTTLGLCYLNNTLTNQYVATKPTITFSKTQLANATIVVGGLNSLNSSNVVYSPSGSVSAVPNVDASLPGLTSFGISAAQHSSQAGPFDVLVDSIWLRGGLHNGSYNSSWKDAGHSVDFAEVSVNSSILEGQVANMTVYGSNNMVDYERVQVIPLNDGSNSYPLTNFDDVRYLKIGFDFNTGDTNSTPYVTSVSFSSNYPSPEITSLFPENGFESDSKSVNFNFSATNGTGAFLKNASLYLCNANLDIVGGGASLMSYISNDSVWYYNDSNVSLTSDWVNSDYDYSSWSQGQSGFHVKSGVGTLGNGINTALKGGTYAYPTYYFARNFSIGNLSKLYNLSFNIDYDDLYMVWINGREVASSNFTCDWSSHSAICQPRHNWLYDDTPEAPFWPRVDLNSTHMSYLNEGNNEIRVAIKQNSFTSSDAAFKMHLYGYYESDPVQNVSCVSEWSMVNSTLLSSYAVQDKSFVNDFANGNYYKWKLEVCSNDDLCSLTSDRYFFVNDSSTGFEDILPPIITINSPNNRSYDFGFLTFNISLNEEGVCNYSLDGGANTSMGSSGSSFNSVLNFDSEASHKVSFYCSDLVGNLAESDVYFSIRPKKQIIFLGVDGVLDERFDEMLAEGLLGNFSKIISQGMKTTANITGHINTETGPGNAELNTGLNSTYTGIVSNSNKGPMPKGITTFERLRAYFQGDIILGSIYGKDNNNYLPNILNNARGDIDWWQQKDSVENTDSSNWWNNNFISGDSAYADSVTVANKALEFLENHSDDSFYFLVYFGVPDQAGHASGSESALYNNSLIDVDKGLGVLLNYLESNDMDDVKIIMSADHGWNKNTTGHGTARYDTIVLPLVSNDADLIGTTSSDGIREQCDIAPTILDYFGIPESNYSDIIENGCSSMAVKYFNIVFKYSNDTIIQTGTYKNGTVITAPTVSDYENESTTFTFAGWTPTFDSVVSQNQEYVASFNEAQKYFNVTFYNYTDVVISSNLYTYGETISVPSLPSNYTNASHIVNYSWNETPSNTATENATYKIIEVVSLKSSQPESPGSSESPGGGSSLSRTLSDSEFERGFTKSMIVGSTMLFNFRSESHKVVVENISKSRVLVSVHSTPQNFELALNETKKVDLNFDGVYDLEITYVKYLNSRAVDLRVKSISEAYTNSVELEKPIEDETESNTDIEEISEGVPENVSEGRFIMSKTFIWIALFLLIIGVGIYLVFLRRKKRFY